MSITQQEILQQLEAGFNAVSTPYAEFYLTLAQRIVAEIPPVSDNLTSTSATSPLSANQGRLLKGLVDALANSPAINALLLEGQNAGYFRSRANHTGTQLATTIEEDAAHRFVSDTEKSSWSAKLSAALIGAANGLAPLGADSLISSVYLPSYVDDVVEYANLAAFPSPGVNSKIYIAIDTNKQYRWSGSTYIEILSGAVQSVNGKTGIVNLVKADVGLSSADNTSDLNKPLSNAAIAALGSKADVSSTVTLSGTQTLTNKTLTAPRLNVGADLAGDMYVRHGDGSLTRIPLGSNGQILKVVNGIPQWTDTASTTLVVNAGSDQSITLPTATIQLAASIISGTVTSWLWERIAGPANYGINAEAAAFIPIRTFTIYPDAQGRALITGATYQAGDLIRLSGIFKSVNIQNLKGTSATERIYISNVPGEVLKIGDPNWSTGQSYAEALNLTPGCQYVTVWGTDVNSFLVEGPTGTGRESYKNVQAAEYSDNIRLCYMTIKNGGTGIDIKKIVQAPADPNSYGDARRIENIQIDNVIVENSYNEAMYLGNTFPYFNITTGAAYYPAAGEVPNPAIYQKPLALTNLKVFNCLIKNAGADGVQIARAIGVEAYKIRIESAGTRLDPSHSAGMIMGGSVENWHAYQNYISNTGGDGFQVFGAAGIVEDTLIDTTRFNNIFLRMETTGTTTVRKVTVLSPGAGSQCIRINGERGGITPVVVESSILVVPDTNRRIYLENGGAVSEGTGNNTNTKVNTYQDAQLDPNNYYLPATDPRGFRKTGDIGLSGTLGANIVTPNAASTLVNGLIEGTHVFRVTGTNSQGSASDTVQVVVSASQTVAPTANAGIDLSIELPDDSVTLNGSGSSAPGSFITGYLWEKVSGPAGGTITNPSGVTTTVTGLLEGTYVFRLTVTNAENLTGTDLTQVTVEAAPVTSPASWQQVQGYAASISAPNQYAMVYLPPNYDPLRVQKYPCFIHLHGQGELGTGTGANGIDKVKTTGAGLYFQSGDQPLDSIHIVPQLATSPGTWEDNWTQAARTWSIANYNVDTARMYIGGYSLGNSGACLSLKNHADQWAAVFGASGDTQYIIGSNASLVVNGVRVADVPYRHAVGSQDTAATNGFKVMDTQGGLATPPKYSVLVDYYFGFGHVAAIWNDRLYNRKNRTGGGGTASWDYIEWCLRYKANDPLFSATSYVAIAETSNDIRDYFQALKYVNDLSASASKTALLGRLANVFTIIKTGHRIVLLDLGTGTAVANWNKASFTGSQGTLSNMVDIDGNVTSMEFNMFFQQWTPPNQNMDYNLSWYGIDKNVLSDAFRVYNGATGQTAPSVWKLKGLTGSTVDLYPIYGLRKGDSEQTGRKSALTITINGTLHTLNDAMQNTTKLPKIAGIVPVANQIDLNLKSVEGNYQADVMGFIIIENL